MLAAGSFPASFQGKKIDGNEMICRTEKRKRIKKKNYLGHTLLYMPRSFKDSL